MSAILAVIVGEQSEAHEFIAKHTTGFAAVREALLKHPDPGVRRASGHLLGRCLQSRADDRRRGQLRGAH